MPIPIDAGSWTEEQILEEIAVRLPKGWGVEYEQDDAFFWRVALLDENKATVWSEDDAALNLVLLNALGWLEFRAAPAPHASPWAPRRREIDARTLHDAAYRLTSEDPPDLDPKEVEALTKEEQEAIRSGRRSVYSRNRRR